MVSWYVSLGRDADSALVVMDDLRSRVTNRVQLTTDGHAAYLEAVEGAFGGYVDYAQLVKVYGEPETKEEARRYSSCDCRGQAGRDREPQRRPYQHFLCGAV